MVRPSFKKTCHFPLVSCLAAAAMIYGSGVSFTPPIAPLAGWSCRQVSLPQRSRMSRMKAFLKYVAFGVNSTEYYVQSEWGQHWTYSKSCDVLSTRKDGGNSTRALSMGFGPYHQYYYEFDNWKYWKIGDPDISKIVKENAVKFVSFGPKGAVIVVLKSGAYYFRNLPTELQDCITGRARSGNEDHNRIASVSLGNNDAYFVTFEDGCWQYSGIPSSMHKYIQEQEIKKNYRNETFEQIAFSQDLEEWYLRTNKRWWYQSRKLRSLEDTYKQ